MGRPSPILDRSGTSPSNDHGEFEADNIREAEGHKPAMMLLDQIGRRAWRRGAPVHWIMTELSGADAETMGPLSVVPPRPYGYTTREMEHFAAVVPEPERAAAAGRQ